MLSSASLGTRTCSYTPRTECNSKSPTQPALLSSSAFRECIQLEPPSFLQAASTESCINVIQDFLVEQEFKSPTLFYF